MVLEAHTVAAAKEVIDAGWSGSAQQLATKIVEIYIRILPSHVADTDGDGVFIYTCELPSLGLLWFGYVDAIREGDGERVLL